VLTRGYIAMPHEWDVFRQEDCGVVGADATRAFLLKQAPRWGAKLFHNVRIDAPIEGLCLRIGGEKREFDAIIVAAGGWAGAMLPEFAKRLSPRRRVLGWFATPEPRMLPVVCVDNDVGLFGMSAPRGLYKIGLHSVGGVVDPDAVEEPNDADREMLSRQARLLLPKHDHTPVRMARCLYTLTPDENFLIAPSSVHERVLIFSACSGHGFKYAPIYGEFAEEWLRGTPSPELEAFSIANRARAATHLGERG
jgi:sarcosine oxidase